MYKLTIEDSAQEWFLGRIQLIMKNMRKDPAPYELPFVEMILGLNKSLESAEHVPNTKQVTEEAKPKKTSAGSAEKLRYGCKEHEKYGAKRRPRTDCEGCWEAFKSYNPDSYAAARREFDRLSTNKEA